MLRIKVFVDQLCKISLTINRESFITLSNTEGSQILVKQINAKLNLL